MQTPINSSNVKVPTSDSNVHVNVMQPNRKESFEGKDLSIDGDLKHSIIDPHICESDCIECIQKDVMSLSNHPNT